MALTGIDLFASLAPELPLPHFVYLEEKLSQPALNGWLSLSEHSWIN
ncbi:MAG: hypothetical protein GY854_18725 [Deltaproteobacteria bacterium]|nr:hypothetical protein [Deltaproteobacteria bacterium]